MKAVRFNGHFRNGRSQDSIQWTGIVGVELLQRASYSNHCSFGGQPLSAPTVSSDEQY
jgi:hypothetical protein